jgi:predicted  nucleic acid-binding Zn-ribbon protein
MLMCTSCGHFVAATTCGGSPTPVSDSCPECGGVEFEDTGSGAVVRSDGS